MNSSFKPRLMQVIYPNRFSFYFSVCYNTINIISFLLLEINIITQFTGFINFIINKSTKKYKNINHLMFFGYRNTQCIESFPT